MASDITVVFKDVDVNSEEEAKDWVSGTLCVLDLYSHKDYSVVKVEDSDA